MPHGGARPNSGPKKKAATILKQLEIEKAHGHAAESLQMLVDMRDACIGNADDREFKKACCVEIMDRVWGKPKMRNEFSGPNGGAIQTSNPAIEKVVGRLDAMTDEQLLNFVCPDIKLPPLVDQPAATTETMP